MYRVSVFHSWHYINPPSFSHAYATRARAHTRTDALFSPLFLSLSFSCPSCYFFLPLQLTVFFARFLSSYLLATSIYSPQAIFLSLFAFSLTPPRTRALHLLVRTPGRTHAIIIIHYLHHHQHRRRHYHCHRS